VAIEPDKGQVVLAPPDGLLDINEDATNIDAGVEKENN
jgi:hypothetical protein